jgi:acetyl esterase/lipase
MKIICRACALSLLLTALAPGQAPQLQFPDGVKAHQDLAYVEGGHERQKLDLYLPEKASGPLPVIIWVHGGGWQAGSKDQCPPLRGGYLERGYAVASIGYRLSQHAIFPAQIEDCKAAIRWLRAHAKEYSLDPQRFGVWGSSAGGHLVALLGTSGDVKEFEVGANLDQSSRVQAVCDYYGPTDFTMFVSTPGYESHATASSPEAKLIGGAVMENKDKAVRVNSITYVSKDDPAFLIMHGDKDPTVPINQSQLLFAALKQAGVSAHFHTIHGAGHGGPGFAGKNIDEMVSAFFDERLKGSGAKVEALATESTANPALMARDPRANAPAGPRRGIPWEAILAHDDKNKDGKVSREEFTGPPQLFERLDANHDGIITREEHEAFQSQQPRQPPTATPKPGASAQPGVRNFQLTSERWTCEADSQPLAGILVKPNGRGNQNG